jgi:transcriptional regulator with XRE-family HTH domain
MMDPDKEEFRRLIELMGWSQTEAARRLRKTPSAINHLVNPDHPNKPTQTMMQLLKLIIASERPDHINTQTYELRETPYGVKPEASILGMQEGELIEKLRQFPPEDRERLYSIIIAMLKSMGGQGGKQKK